MKRSPHVQYVGLHELGLSDIEFARTDVLARKLAKALAAHSSVACTVTVHFKAYSQEGARMKFSVHARYTAPGRTVVSDRAHDWDLRAALHAAFEHLLGRLREQHDREREHVVESGRTMKLQRTAV